VLTAAHCFFTRRTNNRKTNGPTHVVLGEYDIGSENDCAEVGGGEKCASKAQFIPIKDVIIYENYKNTEFTSGHDIALVRLETPATLFIEDENVLVAPVCLPLDSQCPECTGPWADFISRNMTVAGWGAVDNDGSSGESVASIKDLGASVDILQKLSIPVVEPQQCKESNPKFDKDIQLCAGGVLGKDSCSGDSGGPLFYGSGVSSSEPWVQMGVVSYGASRCGEKYGDFVPPAVYTYVPKFMDWIIENLKP